MRVLTAGDPCPCCGNPLPEGLDVSTMALLSLLAQQEAYDNKTARWEENSFAE